MVLISSIWTGLLLGGELSQCGFQIVWKRPNWTPSHTAVWTFTFCSVDNNERSPSNLEENATISKRSQQGMCFYIGKLGMSLWIILLSKACNMFKHLHWSVVFSTHCVPMLLRGNFLDLTFLSVHCSSAPGRRLYEAIQPNCFEGHLCCWAGKLNFNWTFWESWLWS